MQLDQDTTFHTLSNSRRRSVIASLYDAESMTVRELTAAVAAVEYARPPDELEYKQRKRVYTSLVQTHLPSMASYGIVDYDKDRGTVTARPVIHSFGPYLGDDSATTRAWSRTLTAVTAVFGVLTVLLALRVPVVADVSALGLALAATLGLGALAVSYARRAHDRTGPDDGIDDAKRGRPRSVLAATKSLLLFWR